MNYKNFQQFRDDFPDEDEQELIRLLQEIEDQFVRTKEELEKERLVAKFKPLLGKYPITENQCGDCSAWTGSFANCTSFTTTEAK